MSDARATRGPGVGAERGQVVIVAVLVLSLLVAAVGATYTTVSATVERVRLQNAVDAGATAGAAVLADGLNIIAVTNGLLLVLGFGAFFSGGETLKYVRDIQHWQDAVVASTPKVAVSVALGVAMDEGAELAIPTPGQGKGWPSMMVRRVYLLPGLFGHDFPLWMEDRLRHTSRGRFGDRVVLLSAVKRHRTVLGRVVTLVARASSAAAGRRVLSEGVFWPPPLPEYFPRLIDENGS